MEIQYEDSMSCIQCWGTSNPNQPLHYQNQIYCLEPQQYTSNKTSKMSLKKPKIATKPQ